MCVLCARRGLNGARNIKHRMPEFGQKGWEGASDVSHSYILTAD